MAKIEIVRVSRKVRVFESLSSEIGNLKDLGGREGMRSLVIVENVLELHEGEVVDPLYESRFRRLISGDFTHPIEENKIV